MGHDRNLKIQLKSNRWGKSIQRGCSEWQNLSLNGKGWGVNGEGEMYRERTRNILAGKGLGRGRADQKAPEESVLAT